MLNCAIRINESFNQMQQFRLVLIMVDYWLLLVVKNHLSAQM